MASTIQQIETPKCARALDTSGSNNHGQIYSGRALEFDGVTDYLDLGATNTFVDFSVETTQANRAWTVVCWVKPYVITTETNSMNMIGSNVTQSINYLGLRGAGAHVNKLTIYDVGATTWRVSNTALNINTWYRAVWVFDGDTTVSFYLNGVADGTGEIDNTGAYADMALRYIGALNENSRFWDGALADLQLWQGAWSASDVAYDYLNPESLVLSNGGTSLIESNLKAWYPMQDGNRSHQTNILDASNTGLGDELITNGSFTTDSDWNKNSNWTIDTTGGATAVADGSANTDINQVIASHPVVNNVYKVTFDVVSVTAGSVHFLFGGATGTSRDSVGTYSEYITASNTDRLKIDSHASNLFAGSIDNVSVKLVNAKNNATTVFHGDEFITNDPADNRTFDNDAGNWVAHNSTIAWNGSYGASGGGLRVTCNGAGGSSEGTKLTSGNWGSSIVLGRTYLISADIKGHTGELDDFRFTFGNVNTSSFSVTTSFATYTATITPSTTSNSLFIIKTNSNTDTNPYYIDNISVKEVGVATGWTDADQQLHIPQTALQSYNELGMFLGVDDGTDSDASVADDPDIDDVFDGGGTISAWIYPFSDGAADLGRIADKSKWLIYVNGELGGKAYVTIQALTDGDNQISRSQDRDIVLGKWQHVVVTYNASTPGTPAVMYINGEKVDIHEASSGTGTRDSDDGFPLVIGNSGNGTRTFDGCITEFSFWDATLTQAQVTELYNDGKALDATKHSVYTSAATNLKGYWRNNGLSTWTDLSTYGNNGIVSNITETLLIPSGVDGSRDSQGFIMNKQRNTSSLNLTASTDDYVDIPVEIQGSDTLAFLGVGNGFSISCWVKMNNTLNAAEWIINRNDATDGYRLGIDANEKINFSIEENGNLKTAITDSAITVGTWYHVVGTFNGDPTNDTNGDILLYINGVTGSSTTDNITNDSNDMDASANVPLTIGLGHTLYANLEIDGVLMYNDVLTQAEVTRNYNATKGSHRN